MKPLSPLGLYTPTTQQHFPLLPQNSCKEVILFVVVPFIPKPSPELEEVVKHLIKKGLDSLEMEPSPEPPKNKPVSNHPNPLDAAMELKKTLAGTWFSDVCPEPEHYDQNWREQFIDELLESPFGSDIKRQWAIQNKQLSIKGIVVGVLALAGVLKGKNLSIAEAYINPNYNYYNKGKDWTRVKTFAKYIGYAKDAPYLGWVINYVNDKKSI